LLAQKLAEKYPGRSAISMEMFETDRQSILDEYLQNQISEKDFITDSHAWHNYKDYRPVIELAKTEHIPVIAANAPARYVHNVVHKGLASLEELSVAGKSWLPPLPIDTATGAYYQKFQKAMGDHGATGNMQMYQAQNLWDATMAWSIASFLKKHRNFKVFQLNGGFHSENKLGVPQQLVKYYPNIRVLNIACYPDDSFDSPDWSKYSKDNDYIILTDPKLPKTF
jgi:uncharacterized iron-regulated protein